MCNIWRIVFPLSICSIQPIYYQQPSATTLLATATAGQALSTLLPNQSGSAALNGGLHGASSQATGTPSYYELTYTTTPTIEQPSYIYATAAPGQTFSYAPMPAGGTQPSTGAGNLADVYANHAGKYVIDDHVGSVDHESHQRATAGW